MANNDATLVSFYDFSKDTFSTEGIGVLLAIIGTLITAFLVIRQVKGGILLGILITWVLGIICQLTGLYQGASLLPDFSQGCLLYTSHTRLNNLLIVGEDPHQGSRHDLSRRGKKDAYHDGDSKRDPQHPLNRLLILPPPVLSRQDCSP